MSLAFDIQLKRPQFQLSLASRIDGNDFIGIAGNSGSGKTTLLRCLAGLEAEATGRIEIQGQHYSANGRDWPTHQRQLSYVFQDARLMPHLSVEQNLQFAWQRRCNDNGPNITEISELFALHDLLAQSATTLSAGQAQRVAMARAFLRSPRWVLMDEPLASLDTAARQQIMQQLITLQQHLDCPVLYVSHQNEEIARLCQQCLLIEQGQLHSQDSVFSMFTRLDSPLSHGDHALSILNGSITSTDQHYQLSEVSLGQDARLWLRQIAANHGTTLRLCIHARDVSITLSPTNDSSILNQLPATVNAISEEDNASLMLQLNVDRQQLLARITRKSADHLQLQVGMPVIAQVKSVALMQASDEIL